MNFLKQLVVFVFTLFLMLSCQNTPEPKAKRIDKNAVVHLEIGVRGMTCDGCESTVNSSLQKLNGVVSSDASFKNKLVQIEADTNIVSVEDMKKAIRNVGYQIINE